MPPRRPRIQGATGFSPRSLTTDHGFRTNPSGQPRPGDRYLESVMASRRRQVDHVTMSPSRTRGPSSTFQSEPSRTSRGLGSTTDIPTRRRQAKPETRPLRSQVAEGKPWRRIDHDDDLSTLVTVCAEDLAQGRRQHTSEFTGTQPCRHCTNMPKCCGEHAMTLVSLSLNQQSRTRSVAPKAAGAPVPDKSAIPRRLSPWHAMLNTITHRRSPWVRKSARRIGMRTSAPTASEHRTSDDQTVPEPESPWRVLVQRLTRIPGVAARCPQSRRPACGKGRTPRKTKLRSKPTQARLVLNAQRNTLRCSLGTVGYPTVAGIRTANDNPRLRDGGACRYVQLASGHPWLLLSAQALEGR